MAFKKFKNKVFGKKNDNKSINYKKADISSPLIYEASSNVNKNYKDINHNDINTNKIKNQEIEKNTVKQIISNDNLSKKRRPAPQPPVRSPNTKLTSVVNNVKDANVIGSGDNAIKNESIQNAGLKTHSHNLTSGFASSAKKYLAPQPPVRSPNTKLTSVVNNVKDANVIGSGDNAIKNESIQNAGLKTHSHNLTSGLASSAKKYLAPQPPVRSPNTKLTSVVNNVKDTNVIGSDNNITRNEGVQSAEVKTEGQQLGISLTSDIVNFDRSRLKKVDNNSINHVKKNFVDEALEKIKKRRHMIDYDDEKEFDTTKKEKFFSTIDNDAKKTKSAENITNDMNKQIKNAVHEASFEAEKTTANESEKKDFVKGNDLLSEIRNFNKNNLKKSEKADTKNGKGNNKNIYNDIFNAMNSKIKLIQEDPKVIDKPDAVSVRPNNRNYGRQ